MDFFLFKQITSGITYNKTTYFQSFYWYQTELKWFSSSWKLNLSNVLCFQQMTEFLLRPDTTCMHWAVNKHEVDLALAWCIQMRIVKSRKTSFKPFRPSVCWDGRRHVWLNVMISLLYRYLKHLLCISAAKSLHYFISKVLNIFLVLSINLVSSNLLYSIHKVIRINR